MRHRRAGRSAPIHDSRSDPIVRRRAAASGCRSPARWPLARWGSGARVATCAWPHRCASPRRIGIRACRTSSGPWRAAASRSSARSRVRRWSRSSRLGRAGTSGRLRSGRGSGRSFLRTVGPWSARSAGVAAAIAIGDRTGLAQDDEERLQAAGTYHVIAISGGNIAILTLLLVGAAALARRVAPRRRRRRDRRAAGLRPGHRTRAVRRSRDLSRGSLPRRTAHRAAWALDQHPRRRGDARPVDLADGRVRSRLSPVVWRDAWAS